MYAFLSLEMYVCIYINTCVGMYDSRGVCLYICISVYVFVCVCTCAYNCEFLYDCEYIYVCMHICVYEVSVSAGKQPSTPGCHAKCKHKGAPELTRTPENLLGPVQKIECPTCHI